MSVALACKLIFITITENSFTIRIALMDCWEIIRTSSMGMIQCTLRLKLPVYFYPPIEKFHWLLFPSLVFCIIKNAVQIENT